MSLAMGLITGRLLQSTRISPGGRKELGVFGVAVVTIGGFVGFSPCGRKELGVFGVAVVTIVGFVGLVGIIEFVEFDCVSELLLAVLGTILIVFISKLNPARSETDCQNDALVVRSETSPARETIESMVK